MEGRTHRFVAFFIVVLFIMLLSAFNTDGKYLPVFIGIVLGIACICYSRASFWKITKEELEKESSKSKNKDDDTLKEKTAKITKTYKKLEISAWILMGIATIITVISADFLPDLHRGVSIAIALITIPLTVIAGSFLPDMDWDFGEAFHRNPFLHSYILPFTIWIFSMIVVPYEFRVLIIIVGFFCLAYASHLFIDCVPSTTKGLSNILRDFFDFSRTAGDLRKVPETWEHWWLFSSAVILGCCFGLSIPRLYGTHGFDWIGVNEFGSLVWNTEIILLTVFAGVGILVWFIVFQLGMNRENRKKHK